MGGLLVHTEGHRDTEHNEDDHWSSSPTAWRFQPELDPDSRSSTRDPTEAAKAREKEVCHHSEGYRMLQFKGLHTESVRSSHGLSTPRPNYYNSEGYELVLDASRQRACGFTHTPYRPTHPIVRECTVLSRTVHPKPNPPALTPNQTLP